MCRGVWNMTNRRMRRYAAAMRRRKGKRADLVAVSPRQGPTRRDGGPSSIHAARSVIVPRSLVQPKDER